MMYLKSVNQQFFDSVYQVSFYNPLSPYYWWVCCCNLIKNMAYQKIHGLIQSGNIANILFEVNNLI